MNNRMQIRRALLSVWNKQGIVELAQFLTEKEVAIYSTGGTYRKLTEAGIKATKIETVTEFPEVLSGRVKTLHPRIFAGILADTDKQKHTADLDRISAPTFQLVVVNLYPFSEIYQDAEKTDDEIIEMIDVGGPSMLRAAAKNFKQVVVLSRINQYREFIEKFKKNRLDLDYRKRLAGIVFRQSVNYDALIAEYFSADTDSPLPNYVSNSYRKIHTLRYGENPDQKAALYSPEDEGWYPFHQLQGKEISYNNYVDCLSAYQIINQMDVKEPMCVLIKHTNPCGFGLGEDGQSAFLRAVKTDKISFFGGIVCTNIPIDKTFADELRKHFLECIVAPQFMSDAQECLAGKKNLRLLIPNTEALKGNKIYKSYGRGLLVQEEQQVISNGGNWKVVAEGKIDSRTEKALKIGWNLVKQVKSNAIVLADATGTIGVGAGQMSRVDSLKIALRKASEGELDTEGSVIASDAFFPFRDSIDLAAQHGIAGVIQPGGSIRDQEVIDACKEHALFMIFTGQRVFKH